MFTRTTDALLGVLALAGLTQAQATPPPVWASNAATEALDLLAATQQSLQLPDAAGAPFAFEVDLGGVRHTVQLEPHSNRSSAYRLLVQTDAGMEERTSVPKTYRGSLADDPGAIVSASLIDGQLLGMIRLGDGQIWGIQPLTEVEASAPRDAHVVYANDDVVAMDVSCGTAPQWTVEPRAQGGSGGGLAGVAFPKIAEIACDSDFQYYQKLGSDVTAVETRIEAIVNGMEGVYDGEVGIFYEITTIIVRTTSNDPYSSTDIGALLSQFQNHWNQNMSGTQRDVAHMFTGQTPPFGVIGVAYLNTLCNLSSAYGVVERFTTNLTTEIGLSSHEVGHNWSAGHCDGTSGCAIMCSGLGGCSGSITQFGPNATGQITNKKNTVSCLDDFVSPFPPQIFSALPNEIGVFAGDDVAVSGLFFNGTSSVTLNGVPLNPTTGYTVESETSITLHVPPGTALGPLALQVSTPTGPSNVVMLAYVEESPPVMLGNSFTIPILPYNWNFGGGSGDTYILEYSFDPTTLPLGGVDLLANPKKILFSGTLDALGFGSESVVPGPLFGQTAYFQLLTFDPSTGFFEGASNILQVLLS